MENFRFRIGLFGKVILQKRVAYLDDSDQTVYSWEDAVVEDLAWYFSSINRQ